jgi:hypothetical protein
MRSIVIAGGLGLAALLLAINAIAAIVTASPHVRNDARLGAFVVVCCLGASAGAAALVWRSLRRK